MTSDVAEREYRGNTVQPEGDKKERKEAKKSGEQLQWLMKAMQLCLMQTALRIGNIENVVLVQWYEGEGQFTPNDTLLSACMWSKNAGRLAYDVC